MKKIKVLIFSGYGLNCEEETKFAFEQAGGLADIVHVNDLIINKKKLSKYQIAAFPGGFAYGDDTGSGNAYAWKVRNHLWEEIEKFVESDKLVIGICNGFQILVNLGLVPALDYEYGKRESTLLHNSSKRYIDRWVDVKVRNNTPWLANIDTLALPIAHGEGKFYISDKTLKKLKTKRMIALEYVRGEMCKFQNLPANPTGTMDSIAGITNENGRVLGLMPHPERATAFTHLPNWTLLKEGYLRGGNRIPSIGPGMKIFQNAIDYFE